MVTLRSTLIPRLSVTFTIRENFRKFPPNTKLPENLQPYSFICSVLIVELLLAVCVRRSQFTMVYVRHVFYFEAPRRLTLIISNASTR